MKYSKEHVTKLISGLLPLLRETVNVPVTVMKSGGELLAGGIFKTKTGAPIVRSLKYPVTEHNPVKVNHAKKITKLIEAARTQDEMTDFLGHYLKTNGKSLEVIKND